ncbi:MAG: Asp-tRNA(Asn)/Glu-tRNA(Gln) amidotransferase subunit GatA [Chthoniobacterales bacterium]|jgi:aspartyl-tRNA(Asn)/glutamyl-tRNA(Gln) amidotransferase subunit A|nr:Asp-tRNA(Asn)/Glu-tRNA(Gln) amidotransferase subunit GatA [Chthoniobacterales bacterium]
MTPRDLPALTVAELQAMLRRREVSPREVLTALHERIAEVDPRVGAYLSRDLRDALRRAERADVSLSLGGVPVAIKDNINVAGQPCTCASKILGNYRATYDATVITKLVAAGAIPFGKTNLDEFAMGSSTENSSLGTTFNPWDLQRVAGGSSGGSAAAVAADEAFAALGSDTGGSVRQPAALTGIVGLKPTYGRVSRFGVTAFASSLDQVGPLTKNVRDCALMMNALSGGDVQDSTSLHLPATDHTAQLGHDVRGLRLGIAKEHSRPGVDPEVQRLVRAAVDHFASLGAEIVEVSLPQTEYAVAVYYVLATAEASANLARFDGIRYGHRTGNPRDLLDLYQRSRAEGFGPEVKRRIILGTYVLSSGYYDAYYSTALKIRELIRRDFVRVFEQVDALISPTSPIPAFKAGDLGSDPLQMYLADIFTIPANLAGICALSLPCGFAETSDGARLPVGLQLLGRALDEARLLQIGYAYEQSTGWHMQRPPLAHR